MVHLGGRSRYLSFSYLVQIVGLVLESGDNFTEDIKGALSHLIHFPLLTLALYSVISLTNWHTEHFYAVYFTMALIVVRDTSYMHVCVVAEDKYNQWQVPTVGFIIGYISTFYTIQPLVLPPTSCSQAMCFRVSQSMQCWHFLSTIILATSQKYQDKWRTSWASEYFTSMQTNLKETTDPYVLNL